MIVHVGMPKTGTTAIQALLAREDALANTNGIGKDPDWGRRAAGFTCDGAETYRVDGNIGPLLTRPVVSDEDLGLADEPTATQIKETLHATTTVVTVRPFPELCESWWSEQVKHGETRTLVEWMRMVALQPPEDCVDARRVRTDWVAYCWQPNVTLPYSRGVLEQFVDVLRLDVPVVSVPVQNVSLVPEATEALRRFNVVWDVSSGWRGKLVEALGRFRPRVDSLWSESSLTALLRYDEMVSAAMGAGVVADLSVMDVVTRPLDEGLVSAFLREIEDLSCIESGSITASQPVT